MPETAKITEFKIAPPPRAAYTNAFAAMRPVQLNQTLTAHTGQAVPETITEADEPAVWDLRETELAPDRAPSSDEPVSRTENKTEAAPQTAVSQMAPAQSRPAVAAEAPQVPVDAARQILAERIIEQILAQTAKAQDVSVLTMELQPKFLGKIQ
jgi:hypothetical protein